MWLQRVVQKIIVLTVCIYDVYGKFANKLQIKFNDIQT